MGVEIERKFLVKGDAWKKLSSASIPCRQAYMRFAKGVARVRVSGEKAWLTLKGRPKGISRPEFEYEIPVADAKEILDGLCEARQVEKLRHIVEWEGSRWEIDVFSGDNEGLVLAELELRSEDQKFSMPPWIGDEVTGDSRYYNSRLAENPFKSWGCQGSD